MRGRALPVADGGDRGAVDWSVGDADDAALPVIIAYPRGSYALRRYEATQ